MNQEAVSCDDGSEWERRCVASVGSRRTTREDGLKQGGCRLRWQWVAAQSRRESRGVLVGVGEEFRREFVA